MPQWSAKMFHLGILCLIMMSLVANRNKISDKLPRNGGNFSKSLLFFSIRNYIFKKENHWKH